MEFDDRRPLSRMSTVIRNYREQLKDRPDITKNDRRWFAKRELLKGAAIRELRKPVDIRTVTKMDDEAVIHLIDGTLIVLRLTLKEPKTWSHSTLAESSEKLIGFLE